MRHLKQLFVFALISLFSVSMWAAEQTVSWSASAGALGSAIASEGGTASGTISTGSFEWTYTRTLSTLKSGKSDYVAMSGSYLQLGSSNAGEDVEFRTSNIPGTIKSVTVLAGSKDSRHTGTITVGGDDYSAGDIAAWAASAGDNWEGTGTSSGEIVISISCNSKKSPIYIASITVVYEEGGTPTCATPTFSPAAGSVLSGTTVTISCATDGAAIHYTTDGTDPTASSPTYSSAITIDAAKTIKAIAVKDGANNSAIATAAYTIATPLTTMDQIFARATEVGSTATDVAVTFNNWVVTAVKSSNAYVTDGTKGFIIYASGHGFAVGNVLSGTAACKVQLYNGSSELTNLTSTTDGLTVTTGGTASVNVLDDAGIADLSGVKTGSLIKISGECTEEGGKFKIGGVQLYNSLYSFSVSAGTSYNVTGVYVQYNSTKEIMPRNADDIEVSSSVAVTDIDLTESTASVEVGETVTLHASVVPGTATDKAIVWTVESGSDKASVSNGVVTGLAAGTAVIRAAAHEDASIYAECTVTVTAADPTKHVVTFDATVDKTTENTELSITKSNVTIAVTTGDGRFNNGTDYRPYKNAVFTVSCSAGNITKIEFTCTSSKPITGFADETGLDKANEVWTGEAASVSFTASGAQVQMTQLVITYKEDARPAAGLAWDPSDDIELTVGDAFTAPTLLNPNSIDAAEITIESSNPSVATVTAGVVALVADATGTTTITATFAGNASYKPATVSYDITVNPAALTDYYEKVTETAGIVEGTYLIVYEEGSLAFDGSLATLDAESNTIPVTIVGGNKIGVTSTTEASTFYIDPAAGTVKSASDHYIGVSSWGNGLKQTDTYVHNVLEIDGDENAQVGIYNADWNTTGGTMRLQYNKSAGQTRFRYYKNGGQQPIALYKLHGEVIKPAAGLAWDPSDDIELTVGDAFTAPTLLNPNSIDAAEITIESSNPSVATVTAGVVALVADATGTTTITATFAGNASYKPATVSYKIKVNPAHSIYVSPSLTVNFGSVVKDATIDDKVITVTLTNVAAATATLGGTNPEVFSIDPASPAALTASGDITISASSATVGTYNATLTISDDAGEATTRVVTLKLTVTDPASVETPISTTSQWVPATSIADGMAVVITGVKDEVTYAMGEQKSTNRAAYAASIDGEGVLTPGEGTMSFTLVAQGDGTYAIRTSNGKYLYAAKNDANHLKTQDDVDDNAKWTLTVNSAVAESSTNRNVMQFNGGSTKLFACYASASQTAIQFYVPKAPAPTPDYTRTVTVGKIGTLCVPNNVEAGNAQGAVFYQIAGSDGNSIVFDEVTSLNAGEPYVFQATATTISLVYGSTHVDDPVAVKGMIGSFLGENVAITESNKANILYIANNALYDCSDLVGGNLEVVANCCYINRANVTPAHAPAHGVRRISLSKDVATGFDQLEASETPMKLIMDGRLYILRGEKLYDATGRLVK